MKKKVIFLVLTLVFCFMCFNLGKLFKADVLDNDIKESNSLKNLSSLNTLSMMLETEAGSGEYTLETRSSWPTEDDGYVFNEELSKCENGGSLSWNEETSSVVMKGSISDKCYAYFDKYNAITIKSSSATVSGYNIIIKINATAGESEISKYYYSKDNGETYVNSISNTYTFTNLETGTYNIKYYVEDKNGKISEIITKQVTITIVTLASWVKQQYTGIQGENSLYYHNSILENGAKDNSYRYSGSSSSVNNYVCFGSGEETCSHESLYRIIGVFGGKVRLIKADYATSDMLGKYYDYEGTYSYNTSYYQGESTNLTNIAGYYWDKLNYTYDSVDFPNNWSYSELNKTHLNKNYISYLDNINTKWAGMIDTTIWKVGGNTDENMFESNAKTAYTNEITNPSNQVTPTYESKIGLMYVSDYYYAASKTYWTYPGYSSSGASYDYRAATGENWMYMGLEEWTMTRSSSDILDNSDYVYAVSTTGYVYHTTVYDSGNAVRPVFHLVSSTAYVSGTGTKSDPIKIKAD